MDEIKITNYKDLLVWQKGIQLVFLVYKLTATFPREEQYGLTSQMRRAAVSIPSNIAEGSRRGTRKDFRQFLIIAYGSGAELETQIEIAKGLQFGDNGLYETVTTALDEVMRMLNKFTASLE